MTTPAANCESSIEINVATVWDDEQIKRWAQLRDTPYHVGSIFGCLQQQISGHGRAPADVPFVDPGTVVRHAALVKSLGLEFLYLINGRCEHLDLENSTVRKETTRLIRWVVEEVRAACIIVADLRVARLIRDLYDSGRVRIRVSTVAGIKQPLDLIPWIPLEIDGVVLHHDLGRHFSAIKEFVEFASSQAEGAEIELLLNESCLYGCNARDAHYARLARETLGYSEGFQQNCNIPRFRDPYLLLAARWIRPEDIGLYAELGVRRFKIAGREMPAAWLDRTVSAYAQGHYEGNLIDLLTMTPPGLGIGASSLVYLENKALDGFIDDLRCWTGGEMRFYRSLARHLWEMGALLINDPESDYELRAGGPHCTHPGMHLQRLISLQGQSDPVFGGKLVQIGDSRTKQH